MAAHRYWRVYCLAAFNGSNMAFAAIEMAETPGGVNVCTGGTPAASGNWNGATNPVTYCFDGNINTWWASPSAAAGTWVSYDLGAGVTKDVKELRLTARNDAAQDQCAYSGILQWSDNGTTWVDYWTWYQPSSAYGVGTTFTHVAPELWQQGYWETSLFAGNVVIDNRRLVARNLSGTGSAKSAKRISALKTYCEVIVGGSLTGSARFGVCNQSMAVSTLLGADANGLGWDSGGTVKFNNTTLATIAPFTTADNLGMAFDISNQKVWFRKNGGNWNNDVIGNQDPANNIGGISLSTIIGGFAVSWGGSASTSCTLQPDASSWTYSAPSGFVSQSPMTATAVNPRSSGGMTAGAYQAFALKCALLGGRFKYKVYTSSLLNQKISGTVKENGSVAPGKAVYLYDSKTGELLGEAISDASGNFSIPSMGRSKVYAVALDPTFQALVFDQLTPV